jgi:hypothetical protein
MLNCLMGNHYHLMIETPEANLTNQLSRNREGIWRSFHHGGANCAPVNQAGERSPPEKVASDPVVL